MLRRYSARAPEQYATEDAETARVADFVLRLGDLMLASGAATIDIETSIIAVAGALGVQQTEVDITFTGITVSLDRGDGSLPVTRVRVVRRRIGDIGQLARVHALVMRVSHGELTRREALFELSELEQAQPVYPPWVTTLCWGVLAGAVTQLFGGTLLVALMALLSTVLVDLFGRYLRNRAWPDFFLHLTGALTATLVAVGLTVLEIEVRPSLIVAGGIVVLLSGTAIVATVQDALTGYMVTAAGRALEVVLLTGGIIAGVALGLVFVRQFDVVMDVLPPQTLNFSDIPARAVAAAVGAVAYAIASAAPRRALLPAAAAGAAAYLTYFAGFRVFGEAAVATAVAAVAVGFMARLVTTRLRLPPLTLVLPGVVMLLPGLAIMRGMLQISTEQTASGVISLVTALTVAVALAAGAITGEIIAAPLDSGIDRIEHRVAAAQRARRRAGETRTRRRRGLRRQRAYSPVPDAGAEEGVPPSDHGSDAVP